GPAPMEELAPGLWLITGFPRYGINAYLMGDVLVDAMGRQHAGLILKALRGHQVSGHALTHAHPDHQGASHAVCTELGIPYWAPGVRSREADCVGCDTALVATAPRSRPLKQMLRGEVRLPRLDPLLVAAIVCAVGARIAYWAYTGARWEDALITLTHVQNAVNGLGLVHHLGEGRVQGFTSAVSALVPLAGEVLHHGWGLLALRLASLVASAASVTYAWAIARILGLGRLPTVFVLAYLAFDANQILFAVAGMETQIAVAILLGGVYHLLRGQTLRTGAFLGLAML